MRKNNLNLFKEIVFEIYVSLACVSMHHMHAGPVEAIGRVGFPGGGVTDLRKLPYLGVGD